MKWIDTFENLTTMSGIHISKIKEKRKKNTKKPIESQKKIKKMNYQYITKWTLIYKITASGNTIWPKNYEDIPIRHMYLDLRFVVPSAYSSRLLAMC